MFRYGQIVIVTIFVEVSSVGEKTFFFFKLMTLMYGNTVLIKSIRPDRPVLTKRF